MTREPSWRRVAEILAERVGYAALAAGSFPPGDHGEHAGCSHTEAEADPDNCPFCADRAAYQIFLRKRGASS